MIKYNGKDIIPRIDGKEISRVMYNGKQIYPVIPFNGNIIYINQLESDTAKMISGDINGDIIQWIRNNSHRILAKKTGEGTMTYAVLDDNNSTLYSDGTTADLTGAEGDVFVKLPTFYYAGNDDGTGASGDNVEIRFSKDPFNNCVKWDTNTLIGAYKSSFKDQKIYSVSESIFGSTTKENFITYAKNRGAGYQLVDWQMHCVIGCLFYAIYGNTNCQSILGSGSISREKNCGTTNILGMKDTNSNNNNNSINFCGLEDWYGLKSEIMEGIAYYSYLRITSPLEERIIDFTITSGFVSHMKFGKYLDLVPDKSSNEDVSENTYYCDRVFFLKGSYPVVYRSGSEISDEFKNNNGITYLSSTRSNTTMSYISSRLAFRGICTEETDIATFKSLPIL